MKILQIFNRYEHFGGEEACVREMETALRARHEVETFYGSTKEFLGTGVLGKIQAPLKAIWNPNTFQKLRKLQAVEQFDLWLVHNVFPGLSPAVYDAARKCDVPVVQYLHNYRFACVNGLFFNHGEQCFRCLNGNFLPAVRTRCWRDSRVAGAAMGLSLVRLRAAGVLHQVAHWIAVSHAQKKILTRAGIPEGNTSVLYHFYAGAHSEPQSHGNDVLFVGRLSPEKGIRLLVDGWLQERIQNRRLYIVGDGPLKSELEEQTRDCASIKFTGFLDTDALEPIWRKVALTIVPSTVEETFSRVLLESWAHGVPVLGARIGALPELIESTGAGWLFAANSIDSLKKELRRILANPVALSTVAKRCQAAVEAFSPERWLTQIEQILHNAAAPSAPSLTLPTAALESNQ
jgi:glycosyltransferase involved in cell wall biosynthesis